jgi:hypothetical protein
MKRMVLHLLALVVLVALLLSFCGGPLFIAGLLKPILPDKLIFLLTFTPLMIAGLGASSFLELTARKGVPLYRSDWGTRAVIAGVLCVGLVGLMNAFTIWQLVTGPPIADRSLVISGIVAGTLLSGVYLDLARRHQRLARPPTPATKSGRSVLLSAPRLTAQSVLSATEAYLAYSGKRDPRGPNGESNIATILHTRDGGVTWAYLPWHRNLLSRVRYPAFPTWPPEAVMSMEHTPQGVQITHRDEWVVFEPGGESLWRTTLVDANWIPRWQRYMHYEREDSPVQVPEIPLELPSAMRPPQFTNIAIIVQS